MVIQSHYSLNLLRQSQIKCLLRLLFEIDGENMGKTKIKISVIGNRDSWKISARLMHLVSCFCYFLKIADLAFLPVCEVCCVLKPLTRWEK